MKPDLYPLVYPRHVDQHDRSPRAVMVIGANIVDDSMSHEERKLIREQNLKEMILLCKEAGCSG